ncbi:D-alanyl-D-alanine carboxypeptidase family protein [Patescibacteria group bacterium AH-259-L07]|nr:D-alanyl-D-alanine carboxypeptidase family protein [Patescibacteria group bacterium AH-259-L07]
MRISNTEKKIISSLLEKLDKKKTKKDNKIRLVSLSQLYSLLSQKEVVFCKKIFAIDPQKYGFKGRRVGIKPVPKNLIALRNQKYKEKGELKRIAIQYIPRSTYRAFRKLNQALQNDLGKNLLIESGYRSPAYQLHIFFYYLKFYNWNFNKTIKRVALPGYSEHGDPLKPAVDFMEEQGIPSDESSFGFERTREYRWLHKNAKKFGFYLSYPKNNNQGVIFEPWHWRLK